jgi:hypothetical protein
MLDHALRYHNLGWSVIPIKPGTKKPYGRWKRFQTERANIDQIETWFRNGQDIGIAVVLGSVSGGLVCRDFDRMEAYNHWAAKHPELAQTLPTVETGRPGRHVYCRAYADQIRVASQSNGRIIVFRDGELRGGGYCLLPPSRHPNGHVYRAQVPFTADSPFLDLRLAGFLDSGDVTESNRDNRGNGGQPRTTEDNRCHSTGGGGFGAIGGAIPTVETEVELAIYESLPTARNRRNNQVFELARGLKAISAICDAPADDLKPIIVRWHELALPVIETKPFEETWIDFLRAWRTGAVKFPKGAEPMAQVFAKALDADIPDCATQYEQQPLQLLVALCRELQRAADDEPFYLSVRTAGRLLDVSPQHAWRWLFLLQHDGVLCVVTKGCQKTGKASRYRYLADV